MTGFYVMIIADDGTESYEQEIYPWAENATLRYEASFYNPPRAMKIVNYRLRIGGKMRYGRLDLPASLVRGDTITIKGTISMKDFA